MFEMLKECKVFVLVAKNKNFIHKREIKQTVLMEYKKGGKYSSKIGIVADQKKKKWHCSFWGFKIFEHDLRQIF